MDHQLQRYIEDRSIPEPNTGCWLWLLSSGSHGYPQGYAQVDGVRKVTVAHRLSYRAYKGEIPKGYEVDHLCRVRSCVNPDHLEATTTFANRRRQFGYFCEADDRPENCPHGHPYTRVSGNLVCRECHRKY